MATKEKLVRRSVVISGIPKDVNVLKCIEFVLKKRQCKPYVCVRSTDSRPPLVGNPYVVLLENSIEKGKLFSNKVYTFDGRPFTVILPRCTLDDIPWDWVNDPPDYTSRVRPGRTERDDETAGEGAGRQEEPRDLPYYKVIDPIPQTPAEKTSSFNTNGAKGQNEPVACASSSDTNTYSSLKKPNEQSQEQLSSQSKDQPVPTQESTQKYDEPSPNASKPHEDKDSMLLCSTDSKPEETDAPPDRISDGNIPWAEPVPKKESIVDPFDEDEDEDITPRRPTTAPATGRKGRQQMERQMKLQLIHVPAPLPAPEQAPEKASVMVAEKITEKAPVTAAGKAPEKAPVTVAEKAPEKAPVMVSEKVPEKAPANAAEREPETKPWDEPHETSEKSVDPPCTLEVTGMPKHCSEDSLRFYFENKRKSNGGQVVKVELNRKKWTALVHFTKTSDAERVLKQPQHKLEGKTLKVSMVTTKCQEENSEPEKPDSCDVWEEVVESEETLCVEVRGCKFTTSDDALNLYLEDPRRGGGVIVKNIERSEGIVYITLASQKEIDTILQRDHQLDGATLHMKEHCSKPRYLNRFLFSNLNKTTSRSSLKNYLTAVTKCTVLDIMFGEQPGVALAKFDSKNPELFAVLKAECEKEPLDDNHLMVSAVDVSSTMSVQGVNTSTSVETLKSHFEHKRSGIPGQSSVNIVTRGQVYLVEFENFQVASAVLSTPQNLESKTLIVDLYIEKLGLGQREQHKYFKQPVTFTLESLQERKCNFLKNHDQTIFKTAMAKCFAEVNWMTKDSAFLKCTLTEQDSDAAGKAETWRQDAESCFREQMDMVKIIELPTVSDIWAEVAGKIKNLTLPKRVTLLRCKETQLVSVVGYEPEVSDAEAEVKAVIKSVEDDYEKKKKAVTERVEIPKQGCLQLLLKLKIEDTLKKDHQDVKISVDVQNNVIELKGQVHDITSCKAKLYEKALCFNSTEIKDFSEDMVAFTARDEVKKVISDRIDDSGLVSVFYVDTENKKCTILSVSEEMATDTEDLIKKRIVEITEMISPESAELLSKQGWTQLIDGITSCFGSLVYISTSFNHKTILIIAIETFVEEVRKKITSFLDEQSIYSQVIHIPKPIYKFIKIFCDKKLIEIANKLAKRGTLDFGGPQMKLTGCKEGLRVTENELMVLINKVVHRKYTMKRPGIGKYIHSDRIRLVLTDTERTSHCIIELRYDETERVCVEGRPVDKDTGPNAGTIGVQQSHDSNVFSIGSRRQIFVKEGDITEMNVDVIVNAANDRLDHAGGLAKVISEKGGPDIKKESKAYISKYKKVDPGSAAATGPGRLPCRKILHAVGPVWSDGHQGEESTLKSAVMDCLGQTSQLKFTSIALPTLSAGIYGYPEDLATRHIVEAIDKFFALESPNSSITHVYLVDIVPLNVKHFIAALKNLYPGQSSGGGTETRMQSQGVRETACPSPTSKTPSPTEIQISLKKGEIAKQQVDVIVSSVAGDLDLSKGAVSNTILKGGGQSLQTEVQTNYPQGIQPGDMAVSSGGGLQCREVYHACLPDWGSEGAGSLKTVVRTCLKRASDNGHSTLAFPALGAGVLGYPHDVVAQTFYQSIAEFESQNITLRHVTFVIYPSDQNIYDAFQAHQRDITHGGYQNQPPVQMVTNKQASHSSVAKPCLQVELVTGEIAKQKADVIVNSVADDMNMERGYVSLSLLKAGGDTLQGELKQKYPNKLKPGDIAVTSGGTLHCKNIYHTHLVQWDAQTSPQILQDIVVNCLKKADGSGHRSIAFPVLGAGKLQFPRDVVAATIYKAFTTFDSIRKSVDKVSIVIYGMDSQEELKREDEAWKTRQRSEGHVSGPPAPYTDTDIYIGCLSVEIKQGDITREHADCIINSTNQELKLKNGAVSNAILKACGDDIERQCAAKADEMKQQGVISTTARGLPCKYAIHVASSHFRDGWTGVVSSCLHEARKLGDVQSVAFPLLGTGAGSISPTKMADIMVDAFNTFESHAGNVREITIVVFKDSDLDPFESRFREAANNTGKARKPRLQNKDLLSLGSVDLHFFSDDKKKIDKAIKEFEKKCSAELKTDEVKDTKIKDLTDSQIQQLRRHFDVDITIDKDKGLLKITGLVSEIGNVKAEVREHLLVLQKQESAELLARQIQWISLETQTGTQGQFDNEQSAEIERQYQGNAKKYKVPTVGIEIDFSSMQGTRNSEVFTIIRRDLVKAFSHIHPPSDWHPMTEGVTLLIPPPTVAPSTPEYTRVSQTFASSIGTTTYTIHEIKRIQNVTLYQQYVAKRNMMVNHNQGVQNERNLWHGTSPDAFGSINKYGFNKGYCGKNATAIGQGVYFAVNASYSASDTFSAPDQSGNKHMYLCKVLTGEFTLGNSGMRVPPSKPGSTGNTDLFDSVTDNMSAPNMFVIFNDTQAYPEYLITFTL